MQGRKDFSVALGENGIGEAAGGQGEDTGVSNYEVATLAVRELCRF